MEKLSINGIKLSGPLVSLWIGGPAGAPPPLPAVCRMLADLKVNIAFLTSGHLEGRQAVLCCIDPEEGAAVEAALPAEPALAAAVRFGSAVGLLSFYPHQARVEILTAALAAMAHAQIDVHGLASSIAAITLVIDYDALGRAAACLSGRMQMPPDPASFMQDFKVRQR